MSGLREVLPDGWPRGSGYSHGMVAQGRLVVVAGQIGWDPVTRRLAADDMTGQVDQALRNVLAVLHAAGARPEHAARMTWFITDRQAYLDAVKPIGQVWRRHFGHHYPAMSVVMVAGLLEPGALVEIEATAIIPDDSSGASEAMEPGSGHPSQRR
jgi:enamine deaminase RidA (YjgF/YER057c/UK114 family)